ncbi:MAG: ATP-binding protein [Deltaproteobacteria bacterium]|nr:ATP-binding protein [Deltaproteobacteria bacterium]
MTSIVVSVREGGAIEDAEALAAEVRAVMERASVAGARLVGIGPEGASFGFDDGATEEAIDLAVMLVDHGGEGASRWRVGVGVGDLAAVRDEDAFERLSVGPGAARAAALARIAAPGEVLVDLTLPAAAAGSLLATGRRVASLDDQGKRLRAIVLDVHEPWRRAGEATLDRLREPRVVGRESSIAMIESVEPGGLAIVRAGRGVGGTRLLEEIAARAARALLVEPALCGVEPLGALRLSFGRARRPEGAARETELLDQLELGRGLDIGSASDLIRAFIGAVSGSALDERGWVLVDDASLVDRATLDAIGHAASVPGAPFAVVVRLDPGDVVPPPLAQLVVEADVSLKPLQPHEATAVLEDACGGKERVSVEVVRRWGRRGAGFPLAILESLRHGLSVGDLAIRNGRDGSAIVARSKASGRGRVLSAHAWIVRRLAVLEADRPHDALLASIVAIGGWGVRPSVIAEAASDLGVPDGPGLQDALDRLVREAVLVQRGALFSPSSSTLRDAAVDRLDDRTRRRVHAALAGAIARDSLGLELAEGAHHAALAGDQLGAAALAIRAADRARRAGLDEFASSFEAFGRAQSGDVVPMATTPSPPPRPSRASPRPPVLEPSSSGGAEESAGASAQGSSDEAAESTEDVVSLSPSELEELEIIEELREEPPVLASDLAEHEPVPTTVRTPPPVADEPAPPAPEPPPAIALPVIARPSSASTRLTTGQIEALPSPYVPPTDLFAAAREAAPDVESLPRLPRAEAAHPAEPAHPEAIDELAGAARRALAANDLVGFEAALSALEVVGGKSSASVRLRAVLALARKRVAEGIALAREAHALAQTDGQRARSMLTLAIALGVAGDRTAALVEAVAALATERGREGRRPAGIRACRRLVERIADRTLSLPGPSAL